MLLYDTTMKDFFRYLYWFVLVGVMIIALAIFTEINGGDMDMYLKAMRINNG